LPFGLKGNLLSARFFAGEGGGEVWVEAFEVDNVPVGKFDCICDLL